jgi:hypothetical protein
MLSRWTEVGMDSGSSTRNPAHAISRSYFRSADHEGLCESRVLPYRKLSETVYCTSLATSPRWLRKVYEHVDRLRDDCMSGGEQWKV